MLGPVTQHEDNRSGPLQLPWVRSLRFLWMPRPHVLAGGIAAQRNRVYKGIWAPGSVSSTISSVYRAQGWGLNFPGANADFISFGLNDLGINETRFTGSVTAIVSTRMRVPGSGTNYSIGCTLSNNEGWNIVAVGDNTNSQWRSYVRKGGNTFNVGVNRSDLTVGNYTTDIVALRYNAGTSALDIWVNGRKGATSTDTGQAWNSVDSGDFKIGGYPGDNSSERMIGELYWIAIFAEALPDAVIQKWSWTRDVASLVRMDDLFYNVGPAINTANVVTVGDSVVYPGVVSMSTSTSLVADAVMGGDLPTNPPVPDHFETETQVAVDQRHTLVATGLITPYNVVTVTDSVSLVNRYGTRNEVLVRDSFSSFIGGASNQIAARRYRR